MTFPTAVFPYTANVHGNTLLEKEYLDCDVCRIHLQVMLIQNERDQSSKTHFTSCLCIVAEIPSHIYIYSANAHKYMCFRMSCALCFVLALQIISVQP